LCLACSNSFRGPRRFRHARLAATTIRECAMPRLTDDEKLAALEKRKKDIKVAQLKIARETVSVLSWSDVCATNLGRSQLRSGNR
jgi:hypothetical protein